VEYRKYDQPVRPHAIEHVIWKSTDPDSPDVAQFHRELLRCLARSMHGPIDLGNKFTTKTRFARLILVDCNN
jgi:hypothetical protein